MPSLWSAIATVGDVPDSTDFRSIFGAGTSVMMRPSRVPGAARRAALAERCAAEPGPQQTPVLGTVPALRSGMKNAAPRPGHGGERHLNHCSLPAATCGAADRTRKP